MLSGCLGRRYYHRRKERILQELPKGLPLSREELAAQLVGAYVFLTPSYNGFSSLIFLLNF